MGAPTTVEVYVSGEEPTDAPDGEPAAVATAEDPTVTLEPRDAAGRYVVVWFTSLPSVPGGFRGEVAEVVVRGR